jgi:redox-sensing transcriptional repressor
VNQRRADDAPGELSRATAQRLSHYLRYLSTHAPSATISSSQLASAVGISDAQVRRDLAAIGHIGQRGVGYDATALANVIRRTLGIDRGWRAVLVGVGNLARALLRYRGFRDQGFQIVALFDCSHDKIDHEVDGLRVLPVEQLASQVTALQAELGVITVPSESAQVVADSLVAAGVRGLLSFAPMRLKVPDTVQVVTVDLAIQFEQLAFLVNHGNGSPMVS